MRNLEKLSRMVGARRHFCIRLVFLAVLVAALITVGGGCNLVEKIQAMTGQLSPASQGLPDIPIGGLNPQPPQVEKTKVTVYFKNMDGLSLEPTAVAVNKAPGIAKEALDVLCLGPTAEDVNVLASVPADVQVRNINIKADGTCMVNLNGPVQDKLTPREEALAVYALVDTLTEFRDIKRVQIVINGQKRDTLAGHIPIDEPLLRDLSFVNEQE